MMQQSVLGCNSIQEVHLVVTRENENEKSQIHNPRRRRKQRRRRRNEEQGAIEEGEAEGIEEQEDEEEQVEEDDDDEEEDEEEEEDADRASTEDADRASAKALANGMRKLKNAVQIIPGAPAMPGALAMTKVIIYCRETKSPQPFSVVISEWISFNRPSGETCFGQRRQKGHH